MVPPSGCCAGVPLPCPRGERFGLHCDKLEQQALGQLPGELVYVPAAHGRCSGSLCLPGGDANLWGGGGRGPHYNRPSRRVEERRGDQEAKTVVQSININILAGESFKSFSWQK